MEIGAFLSFLHPSDFIQYLTVKSLHDYKQEIGLTTFIIKYLLEMPLWINEKEERFSKPLLLLENSEVWKLNPVLFSKTVVVF